MTPGQSHAECTTKQPPPDPKWTPDIEAEFFARLDDLYPHTPTGRRGPGHTDSLGALKTSLLREYATGTLKAKRINDFYLTTLSAVLANIASAERRHLECIISQRDERLGPRTSVRNIQAEMEAAEVLTRVTRTQGHGFVGDVFVYRPRTGYLPHADPSVELERSYRSGEGEADFFPCPAVSRLS